MIPKVDHVVDIRSQSLALGLENFFSTVSAAKRLRTALRSWKLDTKFGSDDLSSTEVVVSDCRNDGERRRGKKSEQLTKGGGRGLISV